MIDMGILDPQSDTHRTAKCSIGCITDVDDRVHDCTKKTTQRVVAWVAVWAAAWAAWAWACSLESASG
jgi:hypothetical protein